MGLDIRLPIGTMFAIFGVLLAAFGVFGDQSIYERSLGLNINLIWGTVLIAFSWILLWLGSRKGRRNGSISSGGSGSCSTGPEHT